MCCFSGKEDLLSQWRAYGDNGAGVCIGLHIGRIGNRLMSPPTGITSFRDENSKYYQANEFFVSGVSYEGKDYATFYSDMKNYLERSDFSPESMNRVFYAIDAVSCVVKNKFYQEEAESRIVFIPMKFRTGEADIATSFHEINAGMGLSREKFRTLDGRISPYFECDLIANAGVMKRTSDDPPVRNKTAICQVVIGPRCAMSVEEVQNIIEHCYFEDGDQRHEIEVIPSRGRYVG